MENENLEFVKAGECDLTIIGIIDSPNEAAQIIRIATVHVYMNFIRSLAKRV